MVGWAIAHLVHPAKLALYHSIVKLSGKIIIVTLQPSKTYILNTAPFIYTQIKWQLAVGNWVYI